MDLSDDKVKRRAEADRREVDPPIQVESATWSPGGQLDWWVKERQEWLGRVRGADGVNGGSELLIFVRERLIGMTCSVEPWSGVGYRGWPPASYSGAHLRTNCPWSGPQRIAGYRAGVRLEPLSVSVGATTRMLASEYESVNFGRVSSAALMLSGVAGVVMPERVASALQLTPASSRGIAEVRAGLGGTYAALGAWALVSRRRAAGVAVGAAWLGAATVRLVSLAIDRPQTDAAFWAYLVAEVGFGTIALAAARDRLEAEAAAQGRP